MKIELSGHHVEITEAIKDATHTKLAKVQSHYPDIQSFNVILRVERKEQTVEVSTNYLGTVVSVHASNDDLYAAIASSAKKMESALSHRKGTIKSKRHDKPGIMPSAAEPDSAV